MQKILITGDSITDAGRDRSNYNSNGTGYPALVDAKLDCDYPGEYEILNRGISGNRVVDLYARIKVDCINLCPDFLSVLIGVNDVWHELSYQNGVGEKRYEDVYRMFLDDVLAANPKIKILLLTPYLTHGIAVDEKWDCFSSEVKKRRDVVIKLAKEYNLPFINLQDVFDEAVKKAPAEWWTADGVHPTPAGHELISRCWIEKFKEITE